MDCNKLANLTDTISRNLTRKRDNSATSKMASWEFIYL